MLSGASRFFKKLTGRLRRLYSWAADRTPALRVLETSIRRFGRARAAEAAASLAYYAFFSLFPLLLFLVAAGSLVLETEQAYGQLMEGASELFPASQQLIEESLRRVIELRGPVGLIGLVGLLWSAMGTFGVLAYHITSAWPGVQPRPLLRQRLLALKIVGVLLVLLLLSLASSFLAGILPKLELRQLRDLSGLAAGLLSSATSLIPWLFTFLMFLSLYRWVPNTSVRWRAATWGAMVAALAWQLAARAFAWYLASGMVHYELVYGSLGAVVALLLWIYLSNWIALFGAHLTAVIDQECRRPG